MISNYQCGYLDGYYGDCPDQSLYWSYLYWDGFYDGEDDYFEDRELFHEKNNRN